MPAGSKTWISDMEEKGIYENVLGNMAEFIPQMFASTLVNKTADETMIRAYTAPFPNRALCLGAIAFPRDIHVGDNHPSANIMRSIRNKLNLLNDKAKIIIWGMQDQIFPKRVLDWWKKVYPNTESHELYDAGHFLQEDAPEKNNCNHHSFPPQKPLEYFCFPPTVKRPRFIYNGRGGI